MEGIDVRTLIIVSAIMLMLGGAVGFWIADVLADEKLAETNMKHAREMQAVSNAAAEAAAQAAAVRAEIESQVADLDRRRLKDLQDEKVKTDALRAELRAGTKRVSIAARCPTGSGSLPNAATSASLGYAAGRAELDPAAAGDLVGIAADGDAAIRQLGACQEYVSKLLPDVDAR